MQQEERKEKEILATEKKTRTKNFFEEILVIHIATSKQKKEMYKNLILILTPVSDVKFPFPLHFISFHIFPLLNLVDNFLSLLFQQKMSFQTCAEITLLSKKVI
jgi:hypothetical protein